MSTDGIPEATALCRWLEGRFAGEVRLAEPATTKGEGFDSRIYLVRFAGESLPAEWRRPLVVRVKGDADRYAEAQREAAIQDWLADNTYPSPRILHVFAPGEISDRPAQVMERARGALMIEHITGKPWLARRAVRLLAAMHVQLHTMDTTGFPPGDDFLDHRLQLIQDAVEELGDRSLRTALDQVTPLAAALGGPAQSVCHGDFHPLNAFVAPSGGSVIDWTDAAIGDRHGDVSRTLVLFEVAAVASTNPLERATLSVAGPRLGRAYQRGYEERLDLDATRLCKWRPIHLLHGWSQAMSLHAGRFDRGDDDDRRDRVPPRLVEELGRRFQSALRATT